MITKVHINGLLEDICRQSIKILLPPNSLEMEIPLQSKCSIQTCMRKARIYYIKTSISARQRAPYASKLLHKICDSVSFKLYITFLWYIQHTFFLNYLMNQVCHYLFALWIVNCLCRLLFLMSLLLPNIAAQNL